MKIKFATIQDSAEIRKIAQECIIDLSDETNIEKKQKSGFLLKNFPEEEVRSWILDEKNHLVLIAKKNDAESESIGYVTSSSFTKIAEDLQNDLLPSLQKNGISNLEKVIYYRQIAVTRNAPEIKNIGRFLIERFLQEATNFGYEYAVCIIVKEPICNEKSIAFHEKFGFKEIGLRHEIKNEKEIITGIYLKKIN